MPASLVSKATVDEQRRLLTRALRAGIPRDQAEELMQSNADRSREAAVRSLKASFVLRKVADKERIFVLDSEVQQQVDDLGARQGWSARKTEKYMEEHDLMQSLRWDMREDKAVEFIVAEAKMSEIEPDEFARRAQQQQQSEEQEE